VSEELPLPPFYDPANARRFGYRPDAQALFRAAAAWRSEHGLRTQGEDARRLQLLLVDVQRDFCFPEGSLFVGGRSGTGAMDDNDRLARFVYRNLGRISEITCTLDTHFPHQIFFPAFWVDRAGAPLEPHRVIARDEVAAGDVRPNPDLAQWLAGGDLAWLTRQAEFYCAELEREGKYRLYLWPPHCLLGGDGHVLAGVVQEARLFHAFARAARDGTEIKGGHALSENYSVFSPEVLLTHDGGSLGAPNRGLALSLLSGDALVVAGQAASHCVKSSLEGLLDVILEEDAALAKKVYVLRDCMSAVAVPDPSRPGELAADFTPQAEAALDRFADAGMHVVDSTVPISDWR
jgi:nicotinamidase-related amidase